MRRGLACLACSVLIAVLGCSAGDAGSADVGAEDPGPTTTTSTSVAQTTAAPTASEPSVETAVPPTSTSTSTTTPTGGSLEGVVIAIDPGHNGANGSHPNETSRSVDAGGFQKRCNTSGTSANGITESAVNFQVATRLAVMLEDLGATVVSTRPDDSGWGPCIDERGQIGARAGAAALISLHADGADSSASGFHIIHPAVRAGFTDSTAEPSAALARAVRDELVSRGWVPSGYAGADGLHRRDDIGTLNRAEVPAIMIEAGNMHNPSDFSKLTSPEGQEQLAAAIVSALEGIAALEAP